MAIHLLQDQQCNPLAKQVAEFEHNLPHAERYYESLAKLRMSVYQSHLKAGFETDDAFYFASIVTGEYIQDDDAG